MPLRVLGSIPVPPPLGYLPQPLVGALTGFSLLGPRWQPTEYAVAPLKVWVPLGVGPSFLLGAALPAQCPIYGLNHTNLPSPHLDCQET